MIKELRIGNFVNKVNRDHLIHFPESEVLVIQELGYDCVVYPLGKNPANLSKMPVIYCGYLSPISLNEDWLKKFQFIKIDDSYFYKKINQYNEINIDLEDEAVRHDSHWICNIKYVHSLQNLYFALTGKELQITETAQ